MLGLSSAPRLLGSPVGGAPILSQPTWLGLGIDSAKPSSVLGELESSKEGDVVGSSDVRVIWEVAFALSIPKRSRPRSVAIACGWPSAGGDALFLGWCRMRFPAWSWVFTVAVGSAVCSPGLGRWVTPVTYDELIARDKATLDVTWLRDESLEDLDKPAGVQK
jgi:hypothetical protein